MRRAKVVLDRVDIDAARRLLKKSDERLSASEEKLGVESNTTVSVERTLVNNNYLPLDAMLASNGSEIDEKIARVLQFKIPRLKNGEQGPPSTKADPGAVLRETSGVRRRSSDESVVAGEEAVNPLTGLPLSFNVGPRSPTRVVISQGSSADHELEFCELT